MRLGKRNLKFGFGMVSGLFAFVCSAIFLAACTDYEGMLDDEYEAWVKQHGENQQTFDPADLPSTAVVGSFTDSRDGQTYRTAIIGYQVWMAQNLNYNTANSLCNVEKDAEEQAMAQEAEPADDGGFETYDVTEFILKSVITDLFHLKSSDFSCSIEAGRYYTWSAAMTACPSGWHLPSYEDWSYLFSEIGGASVAASKLKAKSGWYSGENGEDTYGFSALPAGYSHDRDFYSVDHGTVFWSSTESSTRFVYSVRMQYENPNVEITKEMKDYALSVRCVSD